jgi:hypothetical protein
MAGAAPTLAYVRAAERDDVLKRLAPEGEPVVTDEGHPDTWRHRMEDLAYWGFEGLRKAEGWLWTG